MKKLYFADGTLRVADATGFWFSSGGVKGSFGYYPHLKDRDGYPIYPDTQIRGDLRIATAWLEGGLAENDPLFPTMRSEGSTLFLTDLALTAASRSSWSPDRFVIKPRIQIDDETSTVKEEMLALKERAWFNRDTLESRLYFGYAREKRQIEFHADRLSKATCLIGGFGAERSRMLYSGRVVLVWDEVVGEIDIPSAQSSDPFESVLALRSLVNLRNRPPSGEKTLLLQCLPYVTAEQLRGWFINAYHLCFEEWPSVSQMRKLRFTDCFPATSEGNAVVLAYPPCGNTRIDAAGIISDSTGRMGDASDIHPEQLLSGKVSSLPRGTFVTNEPHPRIVRVPIERRMRNAMDENFKTKEGALFVQELVPRDTLFAGKVVCGSDDKGFNGRVRFVLRSLRPWISRCLFETSMVESPTQSEHDPETRPALVIHPAPYVDVINSRGDSANQLVLTTIRRYATQLHRPRRNRAAIAPGSVIDDQSPNVVLDTHTISWRGFGSTFQHEAIEGTSFRAEVLKPRQMDEVKLITRSQMGILREFLGLNANALQLRRWVDNALLKNRQGKSGVPQPTLEQIQSLLNDKGLVAAQGYIRDYLDQQRQLLWNRQLSLRKGRFEQARMQFDKDRIGGAE